MRKKQICKRGSQTETEKVEYLDKNVVNEKLRPAVYKTSISSITGKKLNQYALLLLFSYLYNNHYYFFPTYTTITGKQCSVFMPKHQITQHLYRTKCSFFPNCKQILCITTFELLCMSSHSSLFNTVVGSVRFVLL